MTLAITVFAAVIVTAIWYKNALRDDMNLGILCWMFWGASAMWLVDSITEYLEEGTAIFNPTLEALLNDFFLGICVIAFAAIVWIVSLLIKDPKGVLKNKLLRGNN